MNVLSLFSLFCANTQNDSVSSFAYFEDSAKNKEVTTVGVNSIPNVDPKNSAINNKIEPLNPDNPPSFMSKMVQKIINLILEYPIRMSLATGMTLTGIGLIATLNFPLAFVAITCGLASFAEIYYQSSRQANLSAVIDDLKEDIDQIKDINEDNLQAADGIEEKLIEANAKIEGIDSTNSQVANLATEINIELDQLASKFEDQEKIASMKAKIVTILKENKNEKEQLGELKNILDQVAQLTVEIKKGTKKIKEVTLKADADLEKVREAAENDRMKTQILATAGAVAGHYIGGSLGTALGGLGAPMVFGMVKKLFEDDEAILETKKPLNAMQQILLLALRKKVMVETKNGTVPMSENTSLRFNEMYQAIVDPNYSSNKAKEEEASVLATDMYGF